MRKRRLKIVVLGVGASLLLGSGVISAVTDSAASEDNLVDSTSYVEPHDLAIGLVSFDATNPETEDCDDAIWSDGPIGAALFSDVDVNSTFWYSWGSTDTMYCIRNKGVTTGDVYVGIVPGSLVDSEKADVPATEQDEGCTEAESFSDTTCGAGGPGELLGLDFVAHVSFWGVGTEPGNCSGEQEPLQWMDEWPIRIAARLEPGDTCAGQMYFTNGVDAAPEQRRAAQSDRLQWDFVFTLQNA